MQQKELIERISKFILKVKKNHPIRIGIDGVDASGKTTLANALADFFKTQNQDVIRASIDGFHNPKSIRYQKGHNSPEGYYQDSFNNQAIINNLLAPLGKNGDLKYRKAIFDFRTDTEVTSPVETARPTSILIMDGVFLFRPELIKYWDFKIFIEADFAITIKRAIKRDGYYLGSKQEIIDKYNERYIPGQKLYLKEANPKELANLVIDNNDFENPTITQ
ncbi:MAG: cytidylate kinase family protein [Candidatus Gracilibacteria bacterium]